MCSDDLLDGLSHLPDFSKVGENEISGSLIPNLKARWLAGPISSFADELVVHRNPLRPKHLDFANAPRSVQTSIPLSCYLSVDTRTIPEVEDFLRFESPNATGCENAKRRWLKSPDSWVGTAKLNAETVLQGHGFKLRLRRIIR